MLQAGSSSEEPEDLIPLLTWCVPYPAYGMTFPKAFQPVHMLRMVLAHVLLLFLSV